MKNIKYIIIAAFLSTLFTGCSYISDMAESAITTRASFDADAVYDPATQTVTITWDHTDSGQSFAGIEIYRTSEPNREFADYELVASRHETDLLNSGDLENGSTKSCNVNAPDHPPVDPDDPDIHGIFFYRVGFISIEQDDNDVYYHPSNSFEYNQYTSIDAISGYAKVVIP